MSSHTFSRRQILTLPLALLLAPCRGVAAEIRPATRKGAYVVEAGVLYDLFTFRLAGTIAESIDRAAGRYDVVAAGEGSNVGNRTESHGVMYEGRWAPVRTQSWFQVRGRESRSDVTYAHAARTIDYKARGETFFLRKVRTVEDRLAVPPGRHVDDVMSAMFNYVDGLWRPEPNGTYRTWIVRRRKREGEKPDDIDPNPRAELVPFELRVATDGDTGKPTALFDMTRFSTWARRDTPARIVFGPNRRPELITSSLILGTSIKIELREA